MKKIASAIVLLFCYSTNNFSKAYSLLVPVSSRCNFLLFIFLWQAVLLCNIKYCKK